MDIKLYYEGLDIKSIKFYKNGNKKKEKYYDGTIFEYDENGNKIHYKNSDGDEEWYGYDEKGNIIHYKNSDGDEEWYGCK